MWKSIGRFAALVAAALVTTTTPASADAGITATCAESDAFRWCIDAPSPEKARFRIWYADIYRGYAILARNTHTNYDLKVCDTYGDNVGPYAYLDLQTAPDRRHGDQDGAAGGCGEYGVGWPIIKWRLEWGGHATNWFIPPQG